MNDDEKRTALIAKWMNENAVTFTDVLNVVIETNGICGVGLITLADQLSAHIKSMANKG